MAFAKLYGESADQVLVTREVDEDHAPCICVRTQPAGLGVCAVTFSFDDTDSGNDNADAEFAAIDEHKARQIAASIKKLTTGDPQ